MTTPPDGRRSLVRKNRRVTSVRALVITFAGAPTPTGSDAESRAFDSVVRAFEVAWTRGPTPGSRVVLRAGRLTRNGADALPAATAASPGALVITVQGRAGLLREMFDAWCRFSPAGSQACALVPVHPDLVLPVRAAVIDGSFVFDRADTLGQFERRVTRLGLACRPLPEGLLANLAELGWRHAIRLLRAHQAAPRRAARGKRLAPGNASERPRSRKARRLSGTLGR